LNNEIQRRDRITHRLKEEEPITNDDVEKAQDGDVESQQRVESAAKSVLRKGQQVDVETEVKIDSNK
jgi:hypothetical protein